MKFTQPRWLTGMSLLSMMTLVSGCHAQGQAATHTPPADAQSVQTIGRSVSTVNPSAAKNPQPQWQPIHDVILAKTYTPGHSGQILELVDVKGQYAHNPILGPFQGDNWTGQFQLQIVGPTGQIFSKLPLQKDSYSLFMDKFRFHFADYNGDGYPDFSLGQYASSNGYKYHLFSIEPSGLIQLPIQYGAIFTADRNYSQLFPKVSKDSFKITEYDNTKGKWFNIVYTWNGHKFVQNHVVAKNHH